MFLTVTPGRDASPMRLYAPDTSDLQCLTL